MANKTQGAGVLRRENDILRQALQAVEEYLTAQAKENRRITRVLRDALNDSVDWQSVACELDAIIEWLDD